MKRLKKVSAVLCLSFCTFFVNNSCFALIVGCEACIARCPSKEGTCESGVEKCSCSSTGAAPVEGSVKGASDPAKNLSTEGAAPVKKSYRHLTN